MRSWQERADQSINLNAKAFHSVPLRSVRDTGNGMLRSPRQLRQYRQLFGRDDITARLPTPGGRADLRNYDDVYYIIDLKVGNQNVPVSIDTGSSDTWFVQDPLNCIPFNPFVGYPSSPPTVHLPSGLRGVLQQMITAVLCIGWV